MAWIKVAYSCEYGPCPTLYVNPDTGNVRVQGNRVDPHMDIPGYEGMLEFGPSDFANLVEQYLAAKKQ